MTYPFDTNKTLVFKSMAKPEASKHYLNSSPGASKAESVYLSDSIDFTRNPGCHWKHVQQSDGTYRLLTYPWSEKSKCFLDASLVAPADESVYLADSSAGRGSYWIPNKVSDDDTFSLNSIHYMDSNPTASKENSVYLTDSSEPIGTHWKVGVDYYNDTEVEDIIHEVYPSAVVNKYEAGELYGSLDVNLLYGIWKDARVGDHKFKHWKFNLDDYALCLKAAVANYSYNQKLPNNYGSLCGIIWGRYEAHGTSRIHAFNFTIDPFKNPIFFDPEIGKQIDLGEYVPYFCML